GRIKQVSIMRCFSFFALFLWFAVFGLGDSLAQSALPRDITGQVRIDGQPAPAGVPVSLQIVSSRYATSSDEAEIAHTVTDKRGGFTFEHVEAIGRNGGREFFGVSAQTPGYGRTFRVADLTLAAHGQVTLALEKEKVKNTPAEAQSQSDAESAS